MRILQLGCGQKKLEGAIGGDINPLSHADVIYDHNQFPYPFEPDTFDVVIGEHVLEHLDDVIKTMNELHRVSKPGATVRIEVPYFSSIFFYRDPTHKHAFSAHTFDYFINGTAVREFHYSPCEYRLLCAEFPPPKGAGWLKQAFYTILNRNIDFYEKYLAFILPRHTMRFELQVVK